MIRIITDSASDIDFKTENLEVIPLKINFGDDEYLDGLSIDHKMFYEKLIESDVLPTTSLVSPGSFKEVFMKYPDDELLVITVSSKLSGTYNSAVLASSELENVYVLDSLNATIGEQIIVRYALELINKKYSFESIIDELETIKNKVCVIGLLDTLEYLKKGGRISSSTAFVGEMLNIKPVVTVKDGEVVMLGKARGSKNGNNYLIKEITKNAIDFSKPFILGYSGLSDHLLRKYIEDSKSIYIDKVSDLPICSIGSAIGTHVGPGAIAVAYFTK